MEADLHIHTTVSDGSLDPMETLRVADREGLEVVAITDHDTDRAHHMLGRHGGPIPVAVIPALELDTWLDGRVLELLVYGHRVGEGPLAVLLGELNLRRRRRAEIIWASVRRGLGAELPPVSVLYPPPREVATKPQMARLLFESGLVPSLKAAAEVVTAYDPGFSPPSTTEAIRVAGESGGVCVLAHPLQWSGGDLSSLVGDLGDRGLAGIEVKYPYSDPADVGREEEVRFLARRHGLFCTGGSDAHRPEEIGLCRLELPSALRSFLRKP